MKIKKMIAATLFAAATICMLFEISNVVKIKNRRNEYMPFFEDSNQIDVLMFGTSHVACGISPMYLWNHYGITSYNYGNSGERMAVSYWVMEMALEYCTPELVIIDVLCVDDTEKYNGKNVNNSINSFGIFPLSKTKVEAVNDLIEDTPTKVEYLFDVGKYHARWDELGEYDFTCNPSRQKGTWAYGSEDRYFTPKLLTQEPLTKQCAELNDSIIGYQYLCRMIESCQDKNINLLLVNVPYLCPASDQMNANAVAILAEKYEVPYINFVDLNSVIDMSVDMMDNGHLNPSGMNKLTDYLGDYMSREFGLEDHREDAGYENWSEDYIDFLSLKVETFQERTDLKSILELLHDDDFSCCIRVAPNSKAAADDQFISLLHNISKVHILEKSPEGLVSADIKPLNKAESAMLENTGYFLAIDGSTGEFWEASGDEEAEGYLLGDAFAYSMSDGNPMLVFNDSDNLFAYDGGMEPDIQVIVLNNATGEIVMNSRWESGTDFVMIED